MAAIGEKDAASITGAQAIGRATLLLRVVAGCRDGGSLAEIVAAAQLSKPTVRRMLLALIEAGLIEQDPETRRYFLGAETYMLGAIAAARFGIHRLAQEHVLRLARVTGDAAFLQVRRENQVVCLQREDGDFPLRSHVLVAGDRHPLGLGACGVALMAALPEPEAEAMLAGNAALIAQRYPQMGLERVRQAVREARRQGYAVNRGLVFPGSWGMAMAVRDTEGRPDFCLSLAAIESRMSGDREAELVDILTREVERLSERVREFAERSRESAPGLAGPRRPGHATS